MNARTPFPAGLKPRPRPRPDAGARARRADQEFLPAALEILETPPSPVGIWLLWIICLLAVAALAWSWFGRLDVVAVAQGKIQPTGRVKVIQPLETGRIASIRVENGQHVEKGEVLVTFDSGEADADVNQIAAELSAAEAEAARRRAALAALEDRRIEPIPPIEWRGQIPAAIREREAKVLEGDLGKLGSAVAGLEAQLRQKQRESERFAGTVAAVEDLVATLQSRVDMRSSLRNSGSGSKADLIDAMESLQEQKATLAANRGQMAESRAALDVLSRQIEDGYRTFVAENLQKLAEAERQADENTRKLAKVRLRQERMALESPIEGTVSALSITTVGQVVGAGDEVMRIVPERAGETPGGSGSAPNEARAVASGPAAGIEIEAYVANRDIGFVRPGQKAVVKIESFPFTRYGTIEATLVRLAGDAIPQPDADRTEGDPTQSLRDRGFAGAQRTQNLVFPATFSLAAASLTADGAVVPLSPGMAVTVEIKTGSRRILEYLFSPLLEVAGQAMKER